MGVSFPLACLRETVTRSKGNETSLHMGLLFGNSGGSYFPCCERSYVPQLRERACEGRGELPEM